MPEESPKRPDAQSVKNWLISAAWERQRLGLSPAEYNALTPLQIQCELEVADCIERRRNQIVELIDEHFARLEFFANGFYFPDLKSIEDFKILKTKKTKRISNRQKKINDRKNFEMAIKFNALVERLKAERELKLKKKKERLAEGC